MIDTAGARILVAEDGEINIRLIEKIFSKNTDYEVRIARDGQEAVDMLKEFVPDLILLDIMMPKMDGYEVADFVQNEESLSDVPIIFTTALADESFKMKAFEIGGIDYVTKPINKNELLARVRAQVKMKKMQDEMKVKNRLLQDREFHLSQLVEAKTEEIKQITMAMISALENANHYNDQDTGNHIRRVSEYSAFLAELYGCEMDFVRRIHVFASLHDIGKVGIPDSILKKPGRLTTEEFKIMEQHVVIGYKMIDSTVIDDMAKNICLYHHELWSGFGYVNRKKGEEIPLEARIVTLADVYDALSFKRVYKEAFPEEKTDKIILDGKGKHFEPALVDLFMANKKRFIEIKNDLQ